MTDPRIRNLARILVNYSTRVQPGDKVMIWGFPLQPVAAPLVLELYRAVLQAGGHPYTYMTLPGQREILLTVGTDEQLTKDDPIARTVLRDFDADIRIGSPTNTHSLSTIDPSRIRTKGKANRKDWEYAGQQAVRMGDWKGFRRNANKFPAEPIKLYKLTEDMAEKNDVAENRPGIVRMMVQIMNGRTPSPFDKWNFPEAKVD